MIKINNIILVKLNIFLTNDLFFWECKPEVVGSWKSIISILKNR